MMQNLGSCMYLKEQLQSSRNHLLQSCSHQRTLYTVLLLFPWAQFVYFAHIYMVRSKLSKMVAMRKAKQAERYASCRLKGGPLTTEHAAEKLVQSRKDDPHSCKEMKMESRDWIPHPRTGIYFPKGHDWVMEGVPDHAASPGKAYWLRSIDGLEKPDPDLPSDHFLGHHVL
ncbi:hypothetical protein Ancab_027867 [Ancistrocladus abbreviatus]